jgi:predicted AlkP superfamily phosphohydrolase/phosphomutase
MLKNRVLVIALDGVTFKVIRPLAEEGHLPNLSKLMSEGSSAELLSTMPPVSGPAWHAFKTGKSPGQTGLYDFLRYDPQNYRSTLIQLGQLPESMVWNIISQHSACRVGIYDLPTTYPPSKVSGFMVAGFPLPENASDYVYPGELKSELDGLTGGHQTDIRYAGYRHHEDFLRDVEQFLEQRVKVYHYLKKKYDPEFFIFAFTCTDRVQHRMWKYMDPEDHITDPAHLRIKELLKHFWQHLDAVVGELLRTVDEETTVMVVSDHGFGTQDETFYINRWLHDHGFLKLRTDFHSRRSVSSSLSKTVRRVGATITRRFPTPHILTQWGNRLLKGPSLPGANFESLVPMIDWGQTKAYSPSHTSVFGPIYINLKGREGQGAVDPSAYDTVREEIARSLCSLPERFPNVAIKVFKRENLYRGFYLDQAPDLIYVINDFRCISRQSFTQGLVFERRSLRENYTGTHRLEGMMIVKGPHIKKGYWFGRADIIDVAPTLLHILEIPIPQDMDGKVLKDVFEPSSLIAQRKIQFAAPSEREGSVGQEQTLDQTVRKQLEDLGYL